MPVSPRPPGSSAPLAVLWLALALSACELPVAPGAVDYAEELRARKGEVAGVEVVPVEPSPAGHSLRDVTVTSTTGLTARFRLRVPDDASAADPRPLAVLLGGIARGGEAVDLIGPGLPQIGAALWYPPELEPVDPADALDRFEALADLAWDIPAAILLALDHLAGLPEVDTSRVALVGASFGGFFAPAAAGADARVRNLGLLYAGGDLAGLLATHFESELPPAAAVLGADLAALRLQRLEPVRYMADVSPRPVLLVNGLEDDRIVRESAEALIRAARPPKDVVWLPTGHLDPDNEALLQELVDTALARLPVLRTP